MPLKDGKKDDIYHWMIDGDEEFKKFMEMKDHHEGRKTKWKERLTIEGQMEAAKQFTYHERFWNNRK